MPEVNPKVVSHCLAIDDIVELVVQKKRKLVAQKRVAVWGETKKLKKASFIKKISYLMALVKVVMVRKRNAN